MSITISYLTYLSIIEILYRLINYKKNFNLTIIINFEVTLFIMLT